MPLTANEGPTSTTSGARLWPFSEMTAWISAPELASGSALVILMPYFFWKVEMISP